MIAHDFAITIEQRHGKTAVVLAGELDLYRAPEIARALVEATEPGTGGSAAARIVFVDLQAVTFLDSTLLTLLIDADRRQRAHGGELLILVGPQTPMSAFEVTGLDRRLSIQRADALREGHSEPALATPAPASAALSSPMSLGDSR